MNKSKNGKNEKNGKNINNDALVYFVKNTGKAVIDLIQNVGPQLKKFDNVMQTIGTEADKINKKRQKNKSKKLNKKIDSTKITEQPKPVS